jgi:flagellar biosynthesis protein FlhG
MSDQAQKLREMVEGNEPAGPRPLEDTVPRAEVIAVTSGKGGVGKSNVAVNLAVAMARTGLEVGVVDMDLGLANVNLLTGITPTYNLFHVFEGEKEMKDIVTEGPSGIKLVAGANGQEELANLSTKQCERFLNGMSDLDQMVDILIVDTAAGLSESVLQFVCAADKSLVVTTPEPTAIADAYAVIKTALKRNRSVDLNLIINRARSILEAKKVGDKMQDIGSNFLNVSLRVLGYMVEDNDVPRSVRKRVPFYVKFPEGRPAQCIQHMSKRLQGKARLQRPEGIRGFFSKIVDWVN